MASPFHSLVCETKVATLSNVKAFAYDNMLQRLVTNHCFLVHVSMLLFLKVMLWLFVELRK